MNYTQSDITYPLIINLYLIVTDLLRGILTRNLQNTRQMDEELKNSIHKIKKIRDSIKRRAEIYSSLGALDDRGTARALGSLQRASAPGRKIQKIGFILLFAPDPFTTVAGVPMIIAGKYLDRVYNGTTISDIGHATKNFASNISEIKDKMR